MAAVQPLHRGEERLLQRRSDGRGPTVRHSVHSPHAGTPRRACRTARRAAPGQEPTATLTLDAYLRVKAELEELTTHRRERITEKIKVAREHGDLKENAEYHAAKEEQGLMESKIRKLQHMLRDPEIVEAPADADEVGAGHARHDPPARRGRPRRRDLPAGRARRGEGRRARARSPRPRRSAPRCSAPRSSRRWPTRRPPAPCGTWSWASSRSRGDRERAGWHRRDERATRDRPEREAPRVRDMPAPRKNESAAGGAMQRSLAWPYRAILAFLIWTGVRPWQLTLLSPVFIVLAGWQIVGGNWLVAGFLLLVGSLLDVFDGSVARHRGEEKRSGAFMDSVLDRVSDMILFSCLFWNLASQGETAAGGARAAHPDREPRVSARSVRKPRRGRRRVERGSVPAARTHAGADDRPADPGHDVPGVDRARGARRLHRAAARVQRPVTGLTPSPNGRSTRWTS